MRFYHYRFQQERALQNSLISSKKYMALQSVVCICLKRFDKIPKGYEWAGDHAFFRYFLKLFFCAFF